jgi:hypothetical protein
MIGEASEGEVILNGKVIKALIDTGSMVTTVAANYHKKMDPQPELYPMTDFNLKLTGANGQSIPFIGYIEASLRLPTMKETVSIPILVVADTDYNEQLPHDH